MFGIGVERDLLTVKGERRVPEKVYRKVMPRSHAAEEETEEVGE
jgi:hypothetical protein